MVLAEWTFVDMLWTMCIFFLWVMWFWLVIALFTDVFRRNDLSGWAKAGWTALIIFLPFIGIFAYIIARPKMTEQDRQRMAEYQRRSGGVSQADEIEKLAALRASGALSEDEFQTLKQKALA